jgi:hypothetical protein
LYIGQMITKTPPARIAAQTSLPVDFISLGR